MRTRLQSAFPTIAAAMVFLLTLVGLEGLTLSLASERRAETEARAVSFASGIRARVDRELNKTIYLSSGLSAYIEARHGNIDPPEVDAIFAALMRDATYVKNFGIAIGTTLRFVYPEQGNASVIGLDYRKVPAQWPAVNQAINEGIATVTGPLTLVQGGIGLIYRKPIYISSNYWGLLSTVIDLNRFAAASFADVRHPRFQFAVRSKAAPTVPIWGDTSLFSDRSAVQVKSADSGLDWEYAIRPNITVTDALQQSILHVAAVLIAIGFAVVVHTFLRRHAMLKKTSLHDGLTGLPNRQLLADRLVHSLERSKRDQKILAVLFIDLNGFKAVNDQYGHRVGDRLLIEVSQRISGELRRTDTVSRWGGDEFVVILESVDHAGIQQLVLRVRRVVDQPVVIDDHTVQVKAAIGLATSDQDGDDVQCLLSVADQRMYEDKHSLKRLRTVSPVR